MRIRAIAIGFAVVSLLLAAGPLSAPRAYGAQIPLRSLEVSSSYPSATNVLYNLSFTIPASEQVDSIMVSFCGNSALVEDMCIPPSGFSAAAATISSQSGLSGFTLSPSSDANNLILTHAPGNIMGPAAVSVTFAGITNPSAADTYYAKIFTYPTTDASGPYTDFGALAFAMNTNVNVSAEVPPYLIFCQGITISGFDCGTATGDQIALGELSSATSSVGTSQFMTATNAGSGYTVQMTGATMTSGNNTIPALAGGSSQVGTSQFGVNLRANTNPVVGEDPAGPGTATATAGYATPDIFRFAGNDILAQATGVEDYKKFTVSYLVNVAKDQPPGVYSTTLTYICLANF